MRELLWIATSPKRNEITELNSLSANDIRLSSREEIKKCSFFSAVGCNPYTVSSLLGRGQVRRLACIKKLQRGPHRT